MNFKKENREKNVNGLLIFLFSSFTAILIRFSEFQKKQGEKYIYTTIGNVKCTFDVGIASITTKPYILQKILNQ